MSVKFSEINYKTFGKCVKVDNGICTMLITVDVGPRIIGFNMNGMENLLCEDLAENSTRDGKDFDEMFFEGAKWYIYGGHRLWFSPEAYPESYYPDNDKVDYTIDGNSITLTPPQQTAVGIAYQFVITFSENKASVSVTHKITNISKNNKELSPWAMTVVDTESVAIFPQSIKETGLLSNRNLTIWPYTDMQDDRLFIGNKYITVKQTVGTPNFKIGFNDDQGWLGMLNKGQFFMKKFPYVEGAKYPDNGCSCECFTCNFMMEIESLGVLKELSPNETVEHTEEWLISTCSDNFDRKNEQSISKFVDKNFLDK